MNSTVSPPAAPSEASVARLLLVRSEGTKTPLSGPDASPQTVGAGPRCSIRLDGPGLRPLHCVITPTDEGAVIRRWANETRLNGSEFTEAALAAGDIVRVGSIDLRVVEVLPAPPEPVVEPSLTSETPEPPAPEPPTEANDVAVGAFPEQSLEATPQEEPSADDSLFEESLVAESVNELAQVTAEAATSQKPNPFDVEEASEDEPMSQARFAGEPEVVAETPDPAVPSHLLQPWTGGEGTELQSIRDTATTEEPLKAFEALEPQAVVEPTFDAGAPLSGEWAVAGSDAAVAVVDSAAAPPVELANEWAVDPATPEPSATVAEPIVQQDGFAAPAEQEPVEGPVEEVEPFEAAVVAPPVPSPVRSHEGRLVANRLRVMNLVAALRAEREQATLWQAAVEERDAALLAAHEQINEASAAAESNEAERQSLAFANERIAALEAERDDAIEAAAAAADRIELLEQQLAERAASSTEDFPEVEALQQEAPNETPVAAQASVEPEPTEEPSPLWAEAIAEEPPVANEPVGQAVETDPEAPTQVQGPASPAPAAEQPVSEALWGIEQLADATTQPEAEPVDQLVSAEVAVTEPPAEQLVEPVEAETMSDAWHSETEAAPSEAIVESLSLDEAAPEPAPVLDQPTDASEQLSAALKDPFAKPAEEGDDEPHEAPSSFIEQYAHLMPEDDEPVAVPEPLAEPNPVAAEATPADDQDDESIDDYMRKLMGRVRGDAPGAPSDTSNVAEAGPEMPEVRPQLAMPADTPEPVAPIRDLSELKRTPSREINTDMGALRKLANQSARHAIDVAATRQSREQATLRLTASAVAIGCGALASITAISPFDLQFAGGLVGVAVGSWLGLRTLRACQAVARQDELAAAVAGDLIG